MKTRGRTVAVIEARMASSRLPGKVLLPANGRPMLAHLVARLRAVPSIDAIVIATTTADGDAAIEAFASAQCVGCFRGSMTSRSRSTSRQYAPIGNTRRGAKERHATCACPSASITSTSGRDW